VTPEYLVKCRSTQIKVGPRVPKPGGRRSVLPAGKVNELKSPVLAMRAGVTLISPTRRTTTSIRLKICPQLIFDLKKVNTARAGVGPTGCRPGVGIHRCRCGQGLWPDLMITISGYDGGKTGASPLTSIRYVLVRALGAWVCPRRTRRCAVK